MARLLTLQALKCGQVIDSTADICTHLPENLFDASICLVVALFIYHMVVTQGPDDAASSWADHIQSKSPAAYFHPHAKWTWEFMVQTAKSSMLQRSWAG